MSNMDYNLSRLRVIFTIWIVFFHSFNELTKIPPSYSINHHAGLEWIQDLTTLVLQGFVFISGVLHWGGYFYKGKYRKKSVFINDKAHRLLLPYAIWTLLLIALYSVGITEAVCGAKHLWFLLMMFDVMVLATVILPITAKAKVYADMLILVCLIATSFVVPKISVPNILGVKSCAEYLPAFFIGVLFAKYNIARKLDNMRTVPICALFVLAIVSCAVITNISNMPFVSIMRNTSNYILIIFLYGIIQRIYHSEPTNHVMSSIDRNSMGIYILHNFVGKYTIFMLFSAIIPVYNQHYIIIPFMLFIYSFLFAWLSSYLCHKHRMTKILIGS